MSTKNYAISRSLTMLDEVHTLKWSTRIRGASISDTRKANNNLPIDNLFTRVALNSFAY